MWVLSEYFHVVVAAAARTTRPGTGIGRHEKRHTPSGIVLRSGYIIIRSFVVLVVIRTKKQDNL